MFAYIIGAVVLIFLLGKFVLGIPMFTTNNGSGSLDDGKIRDGLCTREYEPVCTDTNEQFANACLAEKA